MSVPESYRGREQAYVKHHLLRTYLERLFMIIGQYQSNIRYVDCFSGPWQEGSNDLQDTSIGIVLKIMQKCRQGLKQIGKEVKFQALFIEKNKDSFSKLESFLSHFNDDGIAAESQKGEFYDLRTSILSWCGPNDFTFFFIDPTGWKKVVEIPTLEPLLRRPNSEFLINFMYDFVLRTHTQESFQDDIQAIFGYTPATTGMSPKQKEDYLIGIYLRRLKEIAPDRGGVARTVRVPILYPLRDRTLYHLVYLTRHARGITVFMEASEKLDLIQRQARSQAKQDNREFRTGQGELELSALFDNSQHEGHVDPNEVRTYWLHKLPYEPKSFGVDQLADMLEETGWFESDFQAAFGNLQKERKVANIDDRTGRRRTKYIHFEANHGQGEDLIRIKP
jgi:three-Cys-motif partner protein